MCWKPAVPPPPVAGATVGIGLGFGLGVTVLLGVTVGLEVGLGVTVGLEVGLGAPLDEAVAVAEALAEDDDVGRRAEGEDDVVQAETVAEASMIKMPQPTAASLALSPVPPMVARTFMEPPHASGRWRPCFPFLPQKPASERQPRAGPVAARAG